MSGNYGFQTRLWHCLSSIFESCLPDVRQYLLNVEFEIGVVKMADMISKEKRHVIMSKKRGKDTKIEVKVRHWLYQHFYIPEKFKNNSTILGSKCVPDKDIICAITFSLLHAFR